MTGWQMVKKFYSFVLRDKPRYFTTMILLAAASGLFRLGPLLYGQIIESVTNADYEYAVLLAATMVVIKVIADFIQTLRYYLSSRIEGKHLFRDAKMEYVKALQYVDYDYHVNKSSGSLISLAKRGDSAMYALLAEVNYDSVEIIFEFLLAVIIISFISPEIATILLVSAIISFALGSYFVQLNVKRRTAMNREDDRITGLVVDNMLGFETVKIFGKEKWEQKRFKDQFKVWLHTYYRFADSFRYIDIVMSIVPAIGFFFTLVYGIRSIENGTIAIGSFITVMIYVFDIASSINRIVFRIRSIAKQFVDLRKYLETMELKPKIGNSPDAGELLDTKGLIEFEEVSFGYNKKQPVLNKINLTIQPDETIALVGKSGGGKTTLTKLLMRFYDVTEGNIKIDGHDIRDVTLHSLRQSIGLVPQEAILFNETIAYNIAYGRNDASQKEIEDAAKKANLDEFIQTLPQKYKTMVGERGIKLSGGQKQRLAIARVILENPEIVIFDEATSQLDSDNEKKIQEAFKNLTKNKTTIVIAHRLSTIMDADRIIVFDKGRIAEQGTHNELIRREDGVYKKLWQLQTESISY